MQQDNFETQCQIVASIDSQNLCCQTPPPPLNHSGRFSLEQIFNPVAIYTEISDLSSLR